MAVREVDTDEHQIAGDDASQMDEFLERRDRDTTRRIDHRGTGLIPTAPVLAGSRAGGIKSVGLPGDPPDNRAGHYNVPP